MYDLYSEGAFLVNMNLSVCLEAQGNCLIVLPVFENVPLQFFYIIQDKFLHKMEIFLPLMHIKQPQDSIYLQVYRDNLFFLRFQVPYKKVYHRKHEVFYLY